MSTTSTQGIIACNTILPVLGIVVVGLRFHVRSTQKVALKVDDWLQIPALLLFVGMAVTALYGVKHRAFGYPTPIQPPTEPADSLILCEKLWFIIQLIQISALSIIKVAALFFYRRIFVASTRSNILNRIIWILMTIIFLWGIGFTAFYIVACGSHVPAAWSGFIGFATYCLDTEKFEEAYAISDFLIDTFVLAIPLPSIWSLHMDVVRKISVTCVFMFALIAIARLVTFVQISNNSLSTALPDVQTNNTQAVWFSSLETGFAIFALNLPSIWPLLSKVSVESIVRSVRSIASLNSNSSRNRSYGEINTAKSTKKDLSAANDDIELVPQRQGTQYKTMTEGDWHSTEGSASQQDVEHEGGIYVKKSIEVTSRSGPGVMVVAIEKGGIPPSSTGELSAFSRLHPGAASPLFFTPIGRENKEFSNTIFKMPIVEKSLEELNAGNEQIGDSPTAPPRELSGLPWALVVTATLASILLYSLDNTIVANIIPLTHYSSIVTDLNNTTELPWLSVGFMIGGLCVALPFGRLYGLLDTRWLYLSSVLLFMTGSALCGAAPNMSAMIVGRVLAGMGGNGMNTGVNTLYAMNTTERERPMYMALVGLTYGIGTVIGPIVGGAFADSSATWRWGFYINLVIGGAFAPVYLLLLPSSKRQPNQPFLDRLQSFDYVGTILQAGFLACGVMALNFGGTLYSWSSGRIIAMFVIASILLLGFSVQQSLLVFTKQETRVFPVQFLKITEPVCCFILMASCSSGTFLVMYYIPLYFQFARGVTSLSSGVNILPFIVTTTAAIMINGAVLSKNGFYKPWYVCGSALALIGGALISRIDLDTPNAKVYGFEVLLGIGFGSWLQSSYSVIQSAIDPSEIVYAVTFIVFSQLLGLAISLSIAGAIFVNTSLQGLENILPNVPVTQLQLAISGASGNFFATLDPTLQRPCLEVIVSSLQKVYILIYVAAAVGLLNRDKPAHSLVCSMEALAAASSIFSVVSLALQLATTVQNIIDFWESMKDAPVEIQEIRAHLKVLSTLLRSIENDAPSSAIIDASDVAQSCLGICAARITKLEILTKEFGKGLNGNGVQRKWTGLKKVLREKKLAVYWGELERAKSTMILYQTLSQGQKQDNMLLLMRQMSRQNDLPGFHSIQNLLYDELSLQSKNDKLTSARIRSHTYDLRLSFGVIRCKSLTNITKEKFSKSGITGINRGLRHKIVKAYFLPNFSRFPFVLIWTIQNHCGSFSSGLQALHIRPHWSPIFEFAAKGDIQNVKILFEEDQASPNDVDPDGWTVLHHAAAGHHAAMCCMLIKLGARADCVTTKHHETPLLLCTGWESWSSHVVEHESGSDQNAILETVQVLVEQGRNDPMEVDWDGLNSVMRSGLSNRRTCISWLLHQDEFEVDVNYALPGGYTVGACIATRDDLLQALLISLLRKGIRVDEPCAEIWYSSYASHIIIKDGILLDIVHRNGKPYPSDVLSLCMGNWLNLLQDVGIDSKEYVRKERELHKNKVLELGLGIKMEARFSEETEPPYIWRVFQGHEEREKGEFVDHISKCADFEKWRQMKPPPPLPKSATLLANNQEMVANKEAAKSRGGDQAFHQTNTVNANRNTSPKSVAEECCTILRSVGYATRYRHEFSAYVAASALFLGCQLLTSARITLCFYLTLNKSLTAPKTRFKRKASRKWRVTASPWRRVGNPALLFDCCSAPHSNTFPNSAPTTKRRLAVYQVSAHETQNHVERITSPPPSLTRTWPGQPFPKLPPHNKMIRLMYQPSCTEECKISHKSHALPRIKDRSLTPEREARPVNGSRLKGECNGKQDEALDSNSGAEEGARPLPAVLPSSVPLEDHGMKRSSSKYHTDSPAIVDRVLLNSNHKSLLRAVRFYAAMFINAKPRIVSNGFGTFVPTQRREPVHQRFVEMTNNDINAWGAFRPVGSSLGSSSALQAAAIAANDNWNQPIDDFSNIENYPLHNLSGGYLQDNTACITQPQRGTLQKGPSYATSQQSQYQNSKRGSVSQQQLYQEMPYNMKCSAKPGLMLGEPYPQLQQWGTDYSQESLADFSTLRQDSKGYHCPTSDGAALTMTTAASTFAQPQSSYADATFAMNSINGTYSAYASANLPFGPQSLTDLDMTTTLNIKNSWWPEYSGSLNGQYQNSLGFMQSHDDLPTPQTLQNRQYSNFWAAGSSSAHKWMSQTARPTTISPKLLTLDVMSPPMSRSASSQESVTSQTTSSESSSGDDGSEFSGREASTIIEQPKAIHPTRRLLPNDIPKSDRTVPILPSNDRSLTMKSANRPLRPKSGSDFPSQSRSSSSNTGRKVKIMSKPPDVAPRKSTAPQRIEPKPQSPSDTTTWTEQPQSTTTAQAMHHRDAKDDFLVRSKLAGMSYKEIRRKGNFTEAESTLRGRFRTLTKAKSARVRKPEWNENDLRLLEKAVRKLTHGSDPSRSKVPWKLVAEYIANNGGSYHFGNATCRKRWDELQEQS
ncbi:hypothetical protein G7Y89_g3062 [Cudoniella acicularis]|uniref:Major facilitator superfamily (MFS) profile domain-containing protein n=1 Tax=Cudoniella acicularis TaxID=354080 RepID=A0A8H4RU68_9HELO|nr:hypothetical protein G7Y89_g3062 [Cudoniella acicularis]